MKRISAAALIVMLAFHAVAQVTTTSSSESITITERNGVERWRTSTIGSDFNIECRGKVILTDDDKDVKAIVDSKGGLPGGGYLEINKTVFGSRRTVVVESMGDGKLKKEYFEGRTLMDWDKYGKPWLGEILPEIVRSTTIGAEGRVDRLFAKGGASAVLSEIEEIESDYVKAHYGKLLLQKNIPNNDIPNVINTLASEIGSDYYLSSLLKDSMTKLLVDKNSADAFFRATDKVGSDYYKSVVLKEALQKYSASPEQVKGILNSAASMSSDYYLSVILTTLLEESDVKEQSLADLVNVSKNIGSDYYRTEVLRRALKKSGISKATVNNVVNAVADVGSDYYKTNVFNELAERATIDSDLQLQVVKILDSSVSSDYYAAVTLEKMLEHQNLSDAAFEQLVMTAGQMSSTSYGAQVLERAGRREMTNAQLLIVLKAASNMNSDHYLTSVLKSLAPKVRNADSAVKDAYRQAARSIDSEYYYGSALRAIE